LHNLTRHSKETEAPPSDPAQLRSAGSANAAAGSTAAGNSSNAEAVPAATAAAAPAAAAAAAAAEEEEEDELAGNNRGILSTWGRGTNIVGSANWRDIFMLRGSSETIRKYNKAQPLPVIAGTSLDELSALGCSRYSYSSEWEGMSQQQQQQKQQMLPRAKSLTQLFMAGNGSSNGRDRGGTGGYSWSRSNSNLHEMDDTPAVSDTGAAAPTVAAAAGALEQLQQQDADGGWSPAAAADSSSNSRGAFGCWPRHTQQQHQQQQGARQQHDDQQGRRGQQRFWSADGTHHHHHHQQQHSHITIPTNALVSPTARALGSFSFPRSRGSIVGGSGSSGGDLGRVSGSGGGKAKLARVPSTRFVLVSRNCSCCKVGSSGCVGGGRG
jgi:hypothetical protein